MSVRSTAVAVVLAAIGVIGVAVGLIASSPVLMGIGLLFTVVSGIMALAGAVTGLAGDVADEKPPAHSIPRREAPTPVAHREREPGPAATPSDAVTPPVSAAPQELEQEKPATDTADAGAPEQEGEPSAAGPPETGEIPARPSSDDADVCQSAVFLGSEPAGVEPIDVLYALLKSVSAFSTPTAAHLWLLDESTGTLRLVGAVGDTPPPCEPVAAQRDAIGAAVESGTAALAVLEMFDGLATATRYIVPLSSGGIRGAAVVDLADSTPDRERLNRSAAHLRGALSASLALHVSHTESTAAAALLQAAAEIVGLTDEQSVLSLALKHAIALSGAHTGSIMLVAEESDSLRIAVSQGLPERVAEETTVAAGEGIAGFVYASGKPLVVEDLEDRGPRSRRHGVRSAAAVPIVSDQGVLGVLNVGSRTFHARFSATHLSTLESLGRVLALALSNAREHTRVWDVHIETVKALALALEARDPYSQGGAERVLRLATGLGEALGMQGAQLHALRLAALLHDVGMDAGGTTAAFADRPLTTVEWGMLKLHPIVAADVLKQAPALRSAVPIVYHHHEHYDGTGYVSGLSGSEIPLGSRVLAVVDSYVAMTSPRPYRAAFSDADALEDLRDKAGSKYDPSVVETFAALLDR